MKNQPNNPNPDWITQIVWNGIYDLEKMPNFVGILGKLVYILIKSLKSRANLRRLRAQLQGVEKMVYEWNS